MKKSTSALRQSVAFILTLLMLCPKEAVYAQSYDLSSTSRSVAAPHGGVIREGGVVRTIAPGQMLTPAELAALNQVTGTGHQSLNIGAAGSAVGGRLDLGTALSGINSLVIPSSVNVLADFGKINGATLAILGDLVNTGNIYAYSTNAATQAATFSAANVLNNAGGTITTILPSSLGISNALALLDLNLNATKSLVNSGVISSSGSLSLQSASGNIVNSGFIRSTTGDINIFAPSDLLINNAGGVMSAANAINIRASGYAGSNLTSIMGGDWLSKQVNIAGGSGDVEVNVGQLTGSLNTVAGVQHVTTNTQLLRLGNLCINGDPTYYNSGGSIALTGPITVGENLAILASRDITGSDVSIRASTGASGRNITLIAGASFSTTGNTTAIGPISPPTPPGTAATITGASPTGGAILLTGAGSINSSGVSGAGGAGNILIAAYGGTSKTSGTINLGTSTLSANGLGGSNGGTITIIGGTKNAITVGNISATGGNAVDSSGNGGNGGNVQITTAQPTFSSGTSLSFDANGNVTSGNTLVADGSTTAGGGTVTVGIINLSGGSGNGGVSGTPGTSGAQGSNGVNRVTAAEPAGMGRMVETAQLVAMAVSAVH